MQSGVAVMTNIVVVYSLFLMQHYNNSEYYQFLRFTNSIGVYRIFYCFQSYVKDEIEKNTESQLANSIQNDQDIEREIEDTMHDTAVISVKNEHSEMPQLSEPTYTAN